MAHKKKQRTIAMSIESKLENVSLIGLAIQGICSHLSLGEVEIYHLELSVIEVVTNVIKHGYRSKPGHTVEVRMSLGPQGVSFQVSDTGEPLDLQLIQSPYFDPGNPDTIPEGGMGLYLIHSLMDTITYESVDGRNIMTLNKRLGGKQ